MRVDHARFYKLLQEVQEQHPEESQAERIKRVYYRIDGLHPKRPLWQWILVAISALMVLLGVSHFLHL